MTLQDLFLSPIYWGLLFLIMSSYANKLSDATMKKAFMEGFHLHIIGAIGFAVVYNFYYGGGDTTLYYQGSQRIYRAFSNAPTEVWQTLIFGKYAAHDIVGLWGNGMPFYEDDPASYMVIRIAGFLSLFCFNTYLILCFFFATFSFIGSWHFYRVVCDIFPKYKKEMSYGIFYFPSVFFWASGLMKDPLSFGAMCFVVYALYFVFIKGKELLRASLLGVLGIVILLSVKGYILYCLIPAFSVWVFLMYSEKIRSQFLRIAIGPFLLAVFSIGGYYLLMQMIEGTAFDLDNVAKKTKVTADYLRQVSSEGSYYEIGPLDGTLGGMLQYLPKAIFIAIFRPFLWEAVNPVMLLAALENTFIAYLTIKVLSKVFNIRALKLIFSNHFIPFAITFTFIFAFWVGIASSNFGTLVRYKIPFIPFYVCSLYAIIAVTEKMRVRKKVKRRRKKQHQDANIRTQPQELIKPSEFFT
ncbi:MAG: hypothetical protein JJT94_08415 [Bernardetiaceae bacterium]|nr:hypothetical protein [Bernardetiaceae bacterium]